MVLAIEALGRGLAATVFHLKLCTNLALTVDKRGSSFSYTARWRDRQSLG